MMSAPTSERDVCHVRQRMPRIVRQHTSLRRPRHTLVIILQRTTFSSTWSVCYLVLLDIFSGFPFLHRCATPTAASSLSTVQQVFLLTGLPRVFLSNGGSAFTSQAFQAFLRDCNVRH